MRKKLVPAMLFSFCIISIGFSAEPTFTDVVSKTGVSCGLAVHIGCESGDLLLDATKSGAFHAYGLTADNITMQNARKKLFDAGVHGSALVNRALRLNPLPFASNQISILIVDLDLPMCQNITQSELDRVVAPYGAMYVKKNGTWTVTKKTVPSDMAPWTHYDGDAGNSAVSLDNTIDVANSIKWYGSYNGAIEWPRISNGKIVFRHSGSNGTMECRDAFSGVLLWKRPTSTKGSMPFVFVNNKIYYPLDGVGQPVSVLNASNGQLLYKLTEGGNFTSSSPMNNGGYGPDYALAANMMMVVAGGKVIQSVNGRVYCLRESDGGLIWSRKLIDSIASYPTLDTVNNRLYIGSGDWLGIGRDYHAKVRRIYALNLQNGDSLWCNSQYGNTHLSQIIWHENKLVLFNHFTSDGGNIARRGPGDGGEFDRLYRDTLNQGMAYMARLNPANGQVMWKRKPFMFMNSTSRFFVYNNIAWHIAMHALNMYNIETGDTISHTHIQKPSFTPWQIKDPDAVGLAIPDQAACSAPVIIGKNIYSGGAYIDPSQWKYRSMLINRSDCGARLFPAFGTVFSAGNNCKCWKMWRGYLATNNDQLISELTPEQRLDKSAISPISSKFIQSSSLSSSPIFQDSRLAMIHAFYDVDSTVTTLGDTRFVNRNNEGLLEAYRNGSIVWTFPVAGRIYGNIIETGGNIYFGSNDGFVYCLNKSTGTQVWRFFIGPSERNIVAFSQMESTYPVYGVCIKNGTIYASGGRVVEGDHGVYVSGINPLTGQEVSRVNFFKDRLWTSLASIDKGAINALRPKFINGPVLAPDSLSNALMIQFFDPATGTSGKTEGNLGWQGFIFDIALSGIVDPNTKQNVKIEYIRPSGSIRVPKSQLVQVISLGNTYSLHLNKPGFYKIKVTDALGKVVFRSNVNCTSVKKVKIPVKGAFFIDVN